MYRFTYGEVVEGLVIDGREVHAKPRAQQAADAARDAALAEHGYVTVRFTDHQIIRRPAAQARRILGIVHRWAPQLDLGARRLEIETERAQTAI